MVQQEGIQAEQQAAAMCCRDQPHINLVFAAELSYVQLLDCSAAVLQCCRRGWGRPLHCLRVCRASPVYSA